MTISIAFDFEELVTEAEIRLRDQLVRFQVIKTTINEFMAKHGIAKAVPLARVSVEEDATSLKLSWRPVYPISRKSADWNADDAYSYENDYRMDMEIHCTGYDGHYRVQIGWNCYIAKNLIITETGIVPCNELHKHMNVSDEWIRQIKLIIADAPRRAREIEEAKLQKPSFFGKIKASIALRKH